MSLLTPADLGAWLLPNRVVLAPSTRAPRAGFDGVEVAANGVYLLATPCRTRGTSSRTRAW
ncbi:hypothetical protein [Amycolatopsis sp. NPDC051128]|uniref:hypothetical protein n=1 Tax=Amycolatopsis sp. NPDC051128 TaxID=3155412 RepID=UPI00343C802E